MRQSGYAQGNVVFLYPEVIENVVAGEPNAPIAPVEEPKKKGFFSFIISLFKIFK